MGNESCECCKRKEAYHLVTYEMDGDLFHVCHVCYFKPYFVPVFHVDLDSPNFELRMEGAL